MSCCCLVVVVCGVVRCVFVCGVCVVGYPSSAFPLVRCGGVPVVCGGVCVVVVGGIAIEGPGV